MGLSTFHSLSPALVGERGSILEFLEPYKKKRGEGEQKGGNYQRKKKESKKKEKRAKKKRTEDKKGDRVRRSETKKLTQIPLLRAKLISNSIH